MQQHKVVKVATDLKIKRTNEGGFVDATETSISSLFVFMRL